MPDPFAPLPAPQLPRGTAAQLQEVIALMGVLPVSADNPAGRLLLFNLSDVIDEFGLPGVGITGASGTQNPNGTTTVTLERALGNENSINFTLPDFSGTSVIGVTQIDNGDGTFTLNFERDQGEADISVVTPDLTGDAGADGVSITNIQSSDNGDGTLTLTFTRDGGALPFTVTTPDLIGPRGVPGLPGTPGSPGDDGDDGVSVTAAEVAVVPVDGLEFNFTLSDASVLTDSVPLRSLLPMLDFKHTTDTSTFVTTVANTFMPAITLTETFEGGTYILMCDYSWANNSTTNDFVARLRLDGADIVNLPGTNGQGNGVFRSHRQEPQDSFGGTLDGSGTNQVIPGFRMAVVNLVPGDHTIALEITPSDPGVEATVYDGIIAAVRVR